MQEHDLTRRNFIRSAAMAAATAILGERAAGQTDERELGLLMAGIDPAKGRAA